MASTRGWLLRSQGSASHFLVNLRSGRSKPGPIAGGRLGSVASRSVWTRQRCPSRRRGDGRRWVEPCRRGGRRRCNRSTHCPPGLAPHPLPGRSAWLACVWVPLQGKGVAKRPNPDRCETRSHGCAGDRRRCGRCRCSRGLIGSIFSIRFAVRGQRLLERRATREEEHDQASAERRGCSVPSDRTPR